MHKFGRVVAVTALTGLSFTASAMADKKPAPPEGTTDDEIKKLTLPTPAQTKVAVLPFGDFGDDKQGFFANKRKSETTLRSSILDCESGELLY